MLEPSHITVLITHNNKTGGFCRILTGLFNSIRKKHIFLFYTKLSSIFCAYNTFIVSCILLTKHKATIWKFRAPAKLTLRKVIITRYDTILHQSECMHFYNHLSN